MNDDLERFRALLSFDPNTGVFRWLVTRSRHAKAGGIAGTRDRDGYIWINVDGKKRSAHRMAWLFTIGQWPEHEIDHVNGSRADNRPVNLRDVPRTVNCQNERQARTTSATGYLGVTRTREGKFSARISVNGKLRHLLTSDSPEKAHAAYVEAKRVLHAGCTI